MANDKDQNTSSQQSTSAGNDVHGRTYNSQNPAFEQQDTPSDISGVDQQEGNMNHGESGGNLTPGNEKK